MLIDNVRIHILYLAIIFSLSAMSLFLLYEERENGNTAISDNGHHVYIMVIETNGVISLTRIPMHDDYLEFQDVNIGDT